jgi:hypothetical protein
MADRCLIRQKTTKIGREIAANLENHRGLSGGREQPCHNWSGLWRQCLVADQTQARLRAASSAARALIRANMALRAAPRWKGSAGMSSFEVATTEAMNFEVRDIGLLQGCFVCVDAN